VLRHYKINTRSFRAACELKESARLANPFGMTFVDGIVVVQNAMPHGVWFSATLLLSALDGYSNL
jgi:hypothetical protein